MKDGVIVELAPIRLAPGKTEADLLQASALFQRDFLDAQAGFQRRDLVRKPGGGYLDIVYWTSRAHAAAMLEKAEASAACAAFFSVMAMEDDSGECLEMLELIARYDAEPPPHRP